jgi:uncharacterized membrane protein YedE/YeeE
MEMREIFTRSLDLFWLRFVSKAYYILLTFYILPSIYLAVKFDLYHFSESTILETNSITSLLLVIIVAPAVETLIFQIGITKGLFFLLRDTFQSTNYRLIASLFIAAIIFGIAHSYNLVYTIFMVLLGMYFSAVYYFSIEAKLKPFWIIFTLHALYNATVVIADLVVKRFYS